MEDGSIHDETMRMLRKVLGDAERIGGHPDVDAFISMGAGGAEPTDTFGHIQRLLLASSYALATEMDRSLSRLEKKQRFIAAMAVALESIAIVADYEP